MGDVADTNDVVVRRLTWKARERRDLSEQVQDFCVLYAIEPVGTKAALAAGYTKSSAPNIAAKWLKDRRAVALIAELRALMPSVQPVDPTAIQSRLAMLAMTDVTEMLVPNEDYPDADPPVYRWKRPEQLTPGERALVQDVFVSDDVQEDEYGNKTNKQTFRYKVLGQKDALDSLARTFGMFRDRIEHEHRHKIDAVFEFIAKHPAESETVAMLNAKHGRNVINQETGEVEK